MLFEEEIQVDSSPVVIPPREKSLWLDKLFSQEKILHRLNLTLDAGRFPHCSLISGPSGSGQLIFALHIVQHLFCKHENKPCGVCDACFKVNQLVHPDLHFSYPTVGAKSLSTSVIDIWRTTLKHNPYINIQHWLEKLDQEGKQGNITADECRNIIERISFRPYEADKTILILWLPEYLGKEGNILLKLLEEPPANAYIILVTENKNQLIQTITSRTQEFRLMPIQMEEAAKKLSALFQLSYDHAYATLTACESDFSLAMRVAADTKNQYMELGRSMLQRTYKGDAAEMIEWIDAFSNLSKDEQKFFINFLTQLFSLTLRIKNKVLVVSENENSILSYAGKLSASLTFDKIEELTKLLDDTSLYISRNANTKILILDLLIKFRNIIRKN